MKNKSLEIVTALRKEFPEVLFLEFCAIVFEAAGIQLFESGTEEDINAVREMLQEAQAAAEQRKRDEAAKIEERVEQITASMLHRRLLLPFLGELADAEHVRAILVFGFLSPSSSKRFVGRNAIPKEHVLENVQNKLNVKFAMTHYDRAMHFLIAHKVIMERPRKATTLLSLNNDERAQGISALGREIVRECKQFMHGVAAPKPPQP